MENYLGIEGDTAGGDVTAGRGGAGPVARSLNAMGLSFPTMDSQNNPDATTFGGQGARALDMVRSFGDKYRAEDDMRGWLGSSSFCHLVVLLFVIEDCADYFHRVSGWRGLYEVISIWSV